MSSLPNVVILGDYERALRRFSNWEKLEKQANLTFHHEPLRDEALYEAVKMLKSLRLCATARHSMKR